MVWYGIGLSSMIPNISTWSYNRESYPRMEHWWRNWSYRTTTSACRYDPTSGSDERNRMCPSTHRVSAEDVPIVRLVHYASRSSRSSLLIWLAKVGNWSRGAWVTRRYELAWNRSDVQVSILLRIWMLHVSFFLDDWLISLLRARGCQYRYGETTVDHRGWCTSSSGNQIDPG